MKPYLITLLCFFILVVPSISLPARQEKLTEESCYGFLVPLPSGTDSTAETFLNSRVRQMINDLLRENVSVFWSSSDFSVLSEDMSPNSSICTRSFEKGTFFIPLSSQRNTTALITAIIFDYNQTNELEPANTLQVPVYYLLSSLSLISYPLVEPKIAQHLGTPTRYGWPCYLLIAEAGGFYTMEFFLDNETSSLLNNQDFNVFMWPYDPDPGTMVEQLQSLTNKEGGNAVRQFVWNGGGYIGSCYGALAASSGFLRPFPYISLRRAYNPDTLCIPPCIGLSISDTIMNRKQILQDTLYVATSTITNTSYPVTYGMNTTVNEFFKGPWFVWLGKNTHQIARVQALYTADLNVQNDPVLQKKVIGTPSWVVSHFGDGKEVLFSSHPEFINNISLLFEGRQWRGDRYYGRRVLHNSLFYVTAEELTTITTTTMYPLAQVERFGEKTTDLSLNTSQDDRFSLLQNRILTLETNLSSFQQMIAELEVLSFHMFNTGIWRNSYRYSLYPYHFSDVYKGYCQKARDTIDTLNDVLSLIQEHNFSFDTGDVSSLTNELSSRIDHADQLLSDVHLIAQHLYDLFRSNSSSLIQRLSIIEQSREMLRTFEIGLKYIPQLFFESVKLLHHLWYQYEASIAVME
ncbi:MAG: hypothetical protein V1726_00795 [Methanobacteriota archaeon]